MTRGGRLFSQNSLKLFFLSANKPRKPCLSKETKLFYCSVLGTDTPQFKLSLSHSLNSESSEHRISPAGAVEGVWGRGGREGRGGVSLCGPGQSGCLPPCLSVWLLCRPHTVVPRRLRPAPLLDPPPPRDPGAVSVRSANPRWAVVTAREQGPPGLREALPPPTQRCSGDRLCHRGGQVPWVCREQCHLDVDQVTSQLFLISLYSPVLYFPVCDGVCSPERT